jgi:hypothetical protein
MGKVKQKSVSRGSLKKLTESVINKILLSKYLYALAEESLKADIPIKRCAGINLLQDSVEVFLNALSEHLAVPIDVKQNFHQYIKGIDKEITSGKAAYKKLPFKGLPQKYKLELLNKWRVDSKHHAIPPPSSEECKKIFIIIGDLYEVLTFNFFGTKLGNINLLELLNEGDVKNHLKEANAFYEKHDYRNCLISCRKAIYITFEMQYSIESYKIKKPNFWMYGFSKAPYVTRDPDYVKKYVRVSTDYIVYDYSDLNIELMKSGIDYNTFWNVLRLTPEVFQRQDNKWIIKYDVNKLDDSILKQNAEYVLNKTIEIFLKMHMSLQSNKYVERNKIIINLKKEGTRVYEKADRRSVVIESTPVGLTEIACDYLISGLNDDDDETYWHVSHIEKEFNIFGFIHNDDVLHEP